MHLGMVLARQLNRPHAFTFALLKPDIVANPIMLKKVFAQIQNEKLIVCAGKRLQMTRTMAESLYEEHKNKFFYERLITHVTSGDIIALRLGTEDQGVDPVIAWRRILGPSKLFKHIITHPDTLRSQFSLSDTRNIGHGSDSTTAINREIAIFEPLNEINGNTAITTLIPELEKMIIDINSTLK